ncbi:hypothetical protein AOQ84DRAFT_59826 [Glonium stellatum]|uniref:Uncharacterized protein n=1 Tax=Glonium stellatum TaxID=574774 RepID=A0A8E2EZ98_9PEZI|nr:hypothetical protein AOQ84DRAFT_59826 [Glonium stellatum]
MPLTKRPEKLEAQPKSALQRSILQTEACGAKPDAGLCHPAPSNGDLAGAWAREPDGMARRGPTSWTWFDPSKAQRHSGLVHTFPALFAKFSRPACRSVISLPARQHINATAFAPICHDFAHCRVNLLTRHGKGRQSFLTLHSRRLPSYLAVHVLEHRDTP